MKNRFPKSYNIRQTTSRSGFSIFLVITMLAAIGILLLAFLRKGSQQAAWTMKSVHERAALEAALAGIAAAEERLFHGRWYAREDPKRSVGQFGLLVDEEMQSTAFVVCQDTYSRIAIPTGEYPTSRGKVLISTPHGYFHTLHSVEVFSRGSCKETTQMVFARFIVSPEPLAYGGSMEGIRFLTDGKRDEFSFDELVFATWEGFVNGAMKTVVTLPTNFNEQGYNSSIYTKWKYQIFVSQGDLVTKGQPLYRAEASWNSITKIAARAGKILKVIHPSGEDYSDEPVLLIRDNNAFESSGHTLKKMVRLTPVPKGLVGNDNPASADGCRAIIRKYINSFNADYLSRSNVVFESEAILSEAPLSDEDAKNILKKSSEPTNDVKFIQKRLPAFVPPGLSMPQKIVFAANASVILDKTPPPPGDPSIDERLIHNHFFGPWPFDKARNAMRFSQPGAIRQMLACLKAKTDSSSLSAYIRTSTTFQEGTYFWKCDYRGPAEERHEIIDDSFDSDPDWTPPPDSEWIQAEGMNYLIFSKNQGEWLDNAYDLEFNGKRIRLSEVAKFLSKIASGSGEISSDTGPEMVLITDVKVQPTSEYLPSEEENEEAYPK